MGLKVEEPVLELDLRRYELRCAGRVLRLERQPMELFILLAEHAGELVTRDEIVKRLWGEGIFLDTERGINNAVRKLRLVLNDDPDQPRYLETVIGKGYRIRVPVKITPRAAPQAGSALPSDVGQASPGKSVAVAAAGKRRQKFWSGRAAAIVLTIVLAGAWWWQTRPAHGLYAIAVLPFKNLSPEPNNDYFSDGLTDELIRNLSIIEGLQVKSRTSSFAFKDKPRNIHEVGQQLAVNLVLEGSVLRAGNRLRINAQLIRVSDDVPLWSQAYDRELKDVFAIQDEISRGIVNELRLKLGGGQRRYNTNLDAYDLYLKAQALEHLRSPQYIARILDGIDLYQKVVAKDPSFAPAYAGIARAYADISVDPPHFSAVEADAKMRVAAEKALQLDPLLSEAYDTMGLVQARELNWAEAERDFRRAIELDPNSSTPHIDMAAYVFHPMGRFEEALHELRKALEQDPLSLSARRQMAFILLSAHRYDEALDYCRQLAALSPDDFFARQFTARALLGKGKAAEAIPILEKLGDNAHHFLGYAYVQVGRSAEAEQLAVRNREWPARQAIIYAALSEKDQALEAMQRMAEMKDVRVDMYPFFPEMSALRGDPRINEFRRQRGLPPMQ